jgi:predicted CopG family antitoxin
MPTTIQVSDDTRQALERMKLFERESYNAIIERVLEDYGELNHKTKLDIEEARKRVRSGNFVKMADVARKYGV